MGLQVELESKFYWPASRVRLKILWACRYSQNQNFIGLQVEQESFWHLTLLTYESCH